MTPGLCGRRVGTEQSGQYLQATACEAATVVTLETQQCTTVQCRVYNTTVQWPDLYPMVLIPQFRFQWQFWNNTFYAVCHPQLDVLGNN